MTAATATALSTEEFVEELRQAIDHAGLTPMNAPFLHKLQAGELTRDKLRTWAEQFYLGTLNAPKWLANDFINCPDPGLAREFAENVYEEMTGKLSGPTTTPSSAGTSCARLGLTDADIAT